MSYKAVIMLVALTFMPFVGFTQDESGYTAGITRLLNWIDDIDEVLSRISSKEKLKRIYRQLGYLGEDLDNLELSKALLTGELSKLAVKDFKSTSEVQQQEILSDIRNDVSSISEDLDRVADRLTSIKSDVSQTDQVQVDDLVPTVRFKIEGKRGIMERIERHLSNATSKNLTKMIEESNKSQKVAELTSTKIKEAKLRIKKKLEHLEKK